MFKKINESLVIKTVLLFLIGAIIPYLLAGFLFLRSSREALYEEIVKGLKTQTELIRDNLDARLFLLRSNTFAWARLEVMKDILVEDIDKRIFHVLQGLKADYRLAGNIYILNKGGKVVASDNPHTVAKKLDSHWVNNVFAGNVVELDAHISDINGKNVITYAVPVRLPSIGPEIIGALILEYHTNDLVRIISTGSIYYVAIINKEDRIVATDYERPFQNIKKQAYPKKNDDPINSPEGFILSSAESKGYYDFKGFNWVVYAAINEVEALYPMRKVARTSLWVGLFGIILIIFMASLFASRTIKPLRDLSMMADRIAKTKNLSLRVQPYSEDEVGKLARAFNNMVEEVMMYINRIQDMEADIIRADRLAALGEVSAGMAHEIKNPLGIIKSSADILKERLLDKNPDGQLAAAVSDEAGRLQRILDAFLEFARPRQPQISPCDVNLILEKSLDLFIPQIKKEGIIIEKKLEDSIPLIEADKDQLHQVFVNIIINAINAMSNGGKISIRTHKIRAHTSVDPSNVIDALEIAISDTGLGISADIKDKIFNPFFTTGVQGTGLGLSIAHRIIEGFGGWIRLGDDNIEGTVFMIYLPIRN